MFANVKYSNACSSMCCIMETGNSTSCTKSVEVNVRDWII